MAWTAFAAPYTRDEHPQESQVFTSGVMSATGGIGLIVTNTTLPMFTLDRACDIESITVRCTTAGSAHGLSFRVAPSGTAPASGTLITAVETADGLTANTPFTIALGVTGSPHLNRSAGDQVCITGAASLASLVGLVVTVRTRTRRVNLNDAGRKEFVQQ